jgi:4-hydroxy-2-oxoheptanedioate aldolase
MGAIEMDFKNNLKEKLSEGKTVFGSWSMIPSPMVANVMAESGIDFIIADLEHGPISLETLENIIYATEAGGASLIARLPNCADEEILKVLEVGIRSVMMSHVKNVETARRFENATKYPPTGSRGLSPFTRIHKYSDEQISQKMLSANREIFTGVLVEGAEGLSSLEEIASLKNLDMIYFGIYDLASSMGIPGELDNPQLIDQLKKSVDIVKASGKVAGTVATNLQRIGFYKQIGFNFIAYKNDTSLLMQSISAGLSEFKK